MMARLYTEATKWFWSCFALLLFVGCDAAKTQPIKGYLPYISYSVAKVDNVPSLGSDITSLASVVHGDDVQSYQYKIGPASTTNCRSFDGYSNDVTVDAWLTDDISALPDGWVRLCVRSRNSDGNLQPISIATEKTWYKETAPASLTIEITTPNDIDYEKNKTVNVQFAMSGTKPYDVIVEYVVMGTLSYGSDYTMPGLSNSKGSLVIPAGQTAKSLRVSLFADSAVELDEHLMISITRVSALGVSTGGRRFMRIDVLDGQQVNIDSVSTYGHTCAIFAGTLKCWGANTFGQLGNGTTTDSAEPVGVSGSDKYRMVSVGSNFTCAITTTGILKCWGLNTAGKLGDGTSTNRLTPATVNSGTTYLSVSAGDTHACAITTSNQLKCWGANSSGAIGDGTTTNRLSPVVINAGVSFAQVSAGQYFTCAIVSTTGELRCWGNNTSGKLGDGSVTQRNSPVTIDSGVSYVQISAGSQQACGITADSVLKCWGASTVNGTSSTSYVPVVVDSGVSYKIISASSNISCGITVSDVLKCWGMTDIGNGSAYVASPTAVSSSVGFSHVTAGASSACALTVYNDLFCWGKGNGLPAYILTPTEIERVDTPVQISIYGDGCSIQEDQSLKCWGESNSVGDGLGYEPRPVPVVVDPGVRYLTVDRGSYVGCGVTDLHILKCWGANAYGLLGNNLAYSGLLPGVVDPGVKYKAVSSRYYNACAITLEGTLKCWGENSYGQVGTGATSFQESLPVPIDTSETYKTVDVGDYHACAITTGEDLKCWGRNNYGQVGDGSTVNKTSPTLINNGVKYSSVSVGSTSSCAITTAGALKCWGRNNSGQVGDGTTTQRNAPVVVNTGIEYESVSVGSYNVCGKLTDSSIRCWGQNLKGQVGDGTTTQRNSPVAIDVGAQYKTVQAGNAFACGITSDDKYKCWGSNYAANMGVPYYEEFANVAPNMKPKLSSTSEIYVYDFDVTPLVGGTVSFSANFIGDSNSNSVVVVYYCNQADSPNCDPSTGASVTLTRGSGVFFGSVSALLASNNTGDTLKILLRTIDPDGAYGEYATTAVIL